jgi:hypothetical protein
MVQSTSHPIWRDLTHYCYQVTMGSRFEYRWLYVASVMEVCSIPTLLSLFQCKLLFGQRKGVGYCTEDLGCLTSQKIFNVKCFNCSLYPSC